MYYFVYFIGRLLWSVFERVLEPFSTKTLKLFVQIGAVFAALVATYIVASYLLGLN